MVAGCTHCSFENPATPRPPKPISVAAGKSTGPTWSRQPKSFSHCPGISSVIFDVCWCCTCSSCCFCFCCCRFVLANMSFAWLVFRFPVYLLAFRLLAIKAAWLSFCRACGALCQTQDRLVIYVANFNLTKVSKKQARVYKYCQGVQNVAVCQFAVGSWQFGFLRFCASDLAPINTRLLVMAARLFPLPPLALMKRQCTRGP